MVKQVVNKTRLAQQLGVSRSGLYYKSKRDEIDQEVKVQIDGVMTDNPGYGHKRIALELKLNKKRILRVMKKYGLKPYRRKHTFPKPKKAKNTYPNLIQEVLNNGGITYVGQVWCSDFTYIKFHNKFVYVTTVIDLFTREIVGISMSRYHNKHMVTAAVNDALLGHNPPEMLHTDQGSEYGSNAFKAFVKAMGTRQSMNAKGSPWQNGYQESFFSRFKEESGDFQRFDELGELIEYVYQQIYYYNNKRIHSALRVPPVVFRQRQGV